MAEALSSSELKGFEPQARTTVIIPEHRRAI
jgi:hypothetical protein